MRSGEFFWGVGNLSSSEVLAMKFVPPKVGIITVDGSEILHQLIICPMVYPIFYQVLYIPGGCLGFLPINSRLKVKV